MEFKGGELHKERTNVDTGGGHEDIKLLTD